MLSPNIIDISALIALVWTMFQQYQINKMCAVCPFRTDSFEKQKEINKKLA